MGKLGCVLVVLGTVAGCSSGGGGDGVLPNDGELTGTAFGFENDAQLNQGLNRLADLVEDSPRVPIADLPSGAARYEGLVEVTAGDPTEPEINVGGLIELEVDFDTNSFTGQVGNFVEVAPASAASGNILTIVGPAEGAASISDGVITSNNAQQPAIFEGTIVGDVTVDDTSLAFDLPIIADVRAGGDAVVGASGENGLSELTDADGTRTIDVEVDFAAELQ